MELADSIEEVKTTCAECNRKAVLNMRKSAGGAPSLEGAQVELGSNDRYSPVCFPCYDKHLPLLPGGSGAAPAR